MAYFGQKRVVLVGEFLMAVANFMVMIFYMNGQPYPTIAMIILFLISY